MSADFKITQNIPAHREAAIIKRTKRSIEPESGEPESHFMTKLRNAARRAAKIQRHQAHERGRDDAHEPDWN